MRGAVEQLSRWGVYHLRHVGRILGATRLADDCNKQRRARHGRYCFSGRILCPHVIAGKPGLQPLQALGAVAGTPEVREYRMRFWDKGMPNGDWTDVVKVTVSP